MSSQNWQHVRRQVLLSLPSGPLTHSRDGGAGETSSLWALPGPLSFVLFTWI